MLTSVTATPCRLSPALAQPSAQHAGVSPKARTSNDCLLCAAQLRRQRQDHGAVQGSRRPAAAAGGVRGTGGLALLLL